MNIAVIFAGGVGKRMNSTTTPKQFLKLHGKEIIIYTLDQFNDCSAIDAIVIACYEPWIPYLKKCISRYGIKKVHAIVSGGKTGQESIYRALCAAKESSAESDNIVLVHDGVRPLIDSNTINENIECVKKNGNAITVAPSIETVIQVSLSGNQVEQIINRSQCCLARAPQSFYLNELLALHERAIQENQLDFIDSASLMQHYGKKIFIVDGPAENIKITTPTDFYTFKAYYEAKEDSQIFGV